MKKKKNILICPLEWGLGHSGRSLVIARKLLASGNNIIIGAGEEHLAFFRKEAPGLSYIIFPGYRPAYSRVLPQYLKLLINLPVIIIHTISEHRQLKKIIKEHNIDIVISDNRFGLWNRDIRSVYITHMPRIPFPRLFRFLEFTGILLHRMIIRRYSLCFIPDLPGEPNISGRLSHGVKLPANARYIGLLSRFQETEGAPAGITEPARHNSVILSGPEPQRGILRKELSDMFKDREPVTVFLGGKPEGSDKVTREGNIIWFDHMDTASMRDTIITSESIITRAGYTSVMELISLGCRAMLIPTPGQTEQEYLASTLSEKGWFASVSQKNIRPEAILVSKAPSWPGDIMTKSKVYLEKAIEELLKD